MGRGLKGIIFGGVIGAALGVLYAPRAGKKTRAMLADKTEALWGEEAQAKGTILGEIAKTTQTAIDAGQSVVKDITSSPVGNAAKTATEKGQQAAKFAQEKVEEFSAANVRPVFSEKNDELRKKIDAARNKIASQVAKNIDDHKESVKVKPASVKTKKPKETNTKPKSTKKTTTKKATKKTTKKPKKK
ncbi:MAG: YtxH domain-containing protein [Coriobacteriia bacterium]|nr:YtxH domain-containing protein [Coriobacteriia bacterium]